MAKWLDKYEQGGLVLKKKTKDNYGKQSNYNDAKASVGPDFVGLGYNTKGRDYSPAWGGRFAMGGALPGAVGFTYARTAGSAPANGKYTKKTKASAQNGSVIKDDRGQWAYPGEVTEIGSNDITMQGVDYPVLGVSDTGDTKMMQPDQDYKFDGKKVTEYPMMQEGGWLDKYQDGGNINKKLKKEAEEFLARQIANRTTMSQYTPKKGEAERLDREKLQRIADENKPLNKFARSKASGNLQDAIEAAMIMEGGLAAGKLVGKGAKAAVKQTGRIYNTVATGESALPIAWKSPAKGISQEASDSMFKGIANANKLSDADRALLLEYQYDSKPFTGRWGKIDQSKRQALNDIIQKNKLNIDNNAILTRKFSPNNKSLGAEFINGRLNLGDRPSSFSAGIGVPSYGSGAVDRLVVPNRYTKQMGNNLLANEYGIPSDKTFDLISGSVKDFAAARGVMADDLINAEREVIGTGLDFKRIGKVKNDIGGYDHIVRPKDATFAKYLTEETALKNAYKLNPFAFKPQEEMMYRGIGKEGMEDALESGLFRAKQNVTPTSIGNFNTTRQFSKAYYTPRFDIADQYGQGFIAEVPREASGWGKRYGTKEWSQIAQRDIPVTEGKVLQKDWLKRYKEVPKKEDGGWLNKYK